jgi:hypothetical protein
MAAFDLERTWARAAVHAPVLATSRAGPVQMQPTDPMAHYNIGNIYMAMLIAKIEKRKKLQSLRQECLQL